MTPEPEAACLVPVLTPFAVDRPYTYASDRPLAPGTIVAVPLGTRLVIGAVWPGRAGRGGAEEAARDRAHLRHAAAAGLADPLRRLGGGLHAGPARHGLRMVLRSPEALEPEKPMVGVRLAGPPPERMTAARAARAGCGRATGSPGRNPASPPRPACRPASSTGCSRRARWSWSRCRPARSPPTSIRTTRARSSRRSRRGAAAALRDAARERASPWRCSTASPARARRRSISRRSPRRCGAGRQALILLPEIALTGAFLDRFAARFGSRPAEWHSEVGAKQRARVWRAVARGEVRARGRRALGALPAVSGPRPDRRR